MNDHHPLDELRALRETGREKARARLDEARNALKSAEDERGAIEARLVEVDERDDVARRELDERLSKGDSGPLVARTGRLHDALAEERERIEARLEQAKKHERQARERLRAAQTELSTRQAELDVLAAEQRADELASRRGSARRDAAGAETRGVHARVRPDPDRGAS